MGIIAKVVVGALALSALGHIVGGSKSQAGSGGTTQVANSAPAARQQSAASRLNEYRGFVERMSAHQSSQCRKIVSGNTGFFLQSATEVSENSELLYKSNLKWAHDGACI
jgi:hypothetical protein